MTPNRVGIVLLATALTAFCAPIAHADDGGFVAGARALGFDESDDQLIRMALSACRFLQPNLGRHPFEVVEHISRHANLEPASVVAEGREPERIPDARQFLALAVSHYCPELTYRVPS